MSLLDVPINRLDGTPATLRELTAGGPTLVVNVASQCGLTPQYTALEALHEKYSDRGFTVVGVPCNQFGAQEPGSPEEIATFCSRSYGVTFPLTEKVEVNGPGRHPLFAALAEVPDRKGKAGDLSWNFVKFLLDADGSPVQRFAATLSPDHDAVVSAIESLL
jgi:glutathione peroxidase